MGLGSRVRISRPPPGKMAWKDLTGTVLTLIPEAKADLEYNILLDSDGSEHNVPGSCLEPLEIEEERERGYIIVNDLMYCPGHRLEVCGECGVDHRVSNFGLEIKPFEDFDIIDQLVENMRQLGVPARIAPSEKSTSKTPLANKALFRPVVNDHLISIEQGFDPSSEEPWPSGFPTYQPARIAAAFGMDESLIPEFAKLPVRRMRENIVVAAHNWDRAFREMTSDEPMVRQLLQDKAQTQVLSLDLVPPVRVRMIRGVPTPIFVVRWAHALATNMDESMAIIGTMERNTRMGEIPVLPDEIELMAELLRKNGERLDPAFVRSVEKHPHLLSVSVLVPITEAAQIAFYESLGEYCHQCGTSGTPTLRCSACQQARYCSKVCQRQNWKHHKTICRKPLG